MTNTIVLLWVNQILAGKKTYNEVPRQLKEEVANILIAKNRMDLILGEM